MTLSDLEAYIAETFAVKPDFPFPRDDTSRVFRHACSRKWFAIAMNVPRAALGIGGGGRADILNVKCDPLVSGSLRERPGFYPAYHMNKDKWLSVLLGETEDGDEIKALVTMSYELTRGKRD